MDVLFYGLQLNLFGSYLDGKLGEPYQGQSMLGSKARIVCRAWAVPGYREVC